MHAFRDVVEAIANGTTVTPNFEDGEKIIRVLEAAQISSREGRKVVLSEME